MFNAEKLLGGMLGGAMGKGLSGNIGKGFGADLARSLGKGSTGGAGKAAIGMGVLGVALAAAEHFLQESHGTQSADATRGAVPPPPAPPAAPGNMADTPPPPPAAGAAFTPAPGPPPSPSAQDFPASQQKKAVLLIRAMIAAAYADGTLDPEERSRIMAHLDTFSLDDEERTFMESELKAPESIESIAEKAISLQLSQQVFAASLLAVEVDTPQEQAYLERLKTLLHLSSENVAAIAQEVGRA